MHYSQSLPACHIVYVKWQLIQSTSYKENQIYKITAAIIIDDTVQSMIYLQNMKEMLHHDLKSSNVLIG